MNHIYLVLLQRKDIDKHTVTAFCPTNLFDYYISAHTLFVRGRTDTTCPERTIVGFPGSTLVQTSVHHQGQHSLASFAVDWACVYLGLQVLIDNFFT